MINKQIEKIAVEDLSDLISEGRNEDRTIEYKLQLPSSADSERIPWLLKPVCSFANTDGGDIIYGIEAKDGSPINLSGIEIDNIDAAKLKLENMIRDGIEPQMRGSYVRDIKLNNGKIVLLVRVPKSWIAPHRVKGDRKFYARNSAGTYELDVPQIRQSFLLSETIGIRMRDFRASRISAIVGDSAPVKLENGLRVVLHLIPISAFATNQQLPAQCFRDIQSQLLKGQANYFCLNFDGLFVATKVDRNVFTEYAQLFRSGILEFVKSYEAVGDKKFVPSLDYERNLLDCYRIGVKALMKLAFEPPLVVLLTLVNAKGYRLTVGYTEQYYPDMPYPFDREVMMIPDVQVESFDKKDIDVLRPMFDIIWNAAGYERSLNFDEDNKPQNRRP